MDIVYSLVVSTDNKWQQKFKKYLTNFNPDRYNFLGEIYASLILLQKNVSWARNIFIITDDQQIDVSFLTKNFQNKIKFIDHKEIIPEEFLPTFNSVIIETFLWNIKGLSDDFLYLNDDFFILNPVCPNNFKYITYAREIHPKYYSQIKRETWKYTDFNAQTIFDKYFPGNKFYVSGFHTPFILNKYMCEYAYKKTYPDLKKSFVFKKRNNSKRGSVHFILICISVAVAMKYVRPVEPPKHKIYQTFSKENAKDVIKNNPTYMNINNITISDLQNLKNVVTYYVAPFRDNEKYEKIKNELKLK